MNKLIVVASLMAALLVSTIGVTTHVNAVAADSAPNTAMQIASGGGSEGISGG